MTTTNTRGVSEAMYTPEQLERRARHFENAGILDVAAMLRAYAATLRQAPAQGGVTEAIRLIAQFLRALSPDGEEWRSSNPNNSSVLDLRKLADKLEAALSAPEPAAQGEAVYYEKRDWRPDGGWHRIDKATFEQYENYHERFGGKSPVRALGVIATPAQPAHGSDGDESYETSVNPTVRAAYADGYDVGYAHGKAAQPAERVPEHSIREAIHAMRRCKAMSNHPDWDVHIANIEKLLTASPAPSEGGKGVES